MISTDILFAVSDLYQFKNRRKLPLEDFNRYLKMANTDLKRAVYGRIGEKEGAETEQQIMDALLPFKITDPITKINGVFNLPPEYWHKIYMETVDGTEIKFVTGNESIRRRNCSIDFPSVKYPIVELLSNKFVVYPSTINSVNFTYWHEDFPEIKADLMHGVTNYSPDPNILWGEDRYPDLIRLILGYLNIPMSNEQVLQYIEAKTDKEN